MDLFTFQDMMSFGVLIIQLMMLVVSIVIGIMTLAFMIMKRK